MGVDATDKALCVAAADGGLVFALAERAGLSSWVLFFLDRPGPGVERVDVFGFGGGRTGDDSRDTIGEFAAEVTRLVCNFFAAGGIEDVDADDSRMGLRLSTGSAVSWVERPVMGAKDLSSMVLVATAVYLVWFGLAASGSGSLVARGETSLALPSESTPNTQTTSPLLSFWRGGVAISAETREAYEGKMAASQGIWGNLGRSVAVVVGVSVGGREESRVERFS